MSGQHLVTVTGSTVMLVAAFAAGGLIWVTATDPLFVAALAATGDGLTLLGAIAGRLLATLW